MIRTLDMSGLPATWDDVSGEITGLGADRLLALLEGVVADGYVLGPPFPSRYAISDPIRRPQEMAAVLASFDLPLPAGLDWTPRASAIPADAVA